MPPRKGCMIVGEGDGRTVDIDVDADAEADGSISLAEGGEWGGYYDTTAGGRRWISDLMVMMW